MSLARDDMVDLQVHLRQRLVHVLHVLTGGHDQLAAVPQHGPNGANVLLGSKQSARLSDRLQELQPLALVPIGAAPRYVLHVARIH
jgi:hypothetical protein